MILSHKYKLLFIHLGKTAGDSITHALKDFLAADDIFKENKNKHIFFRKHTKARELVKAFRDLNLNWSDYFSFLVIRNPFEILHSDFWYHKYTGYRLFPSKAPTPDLTDYDWLLKCWKAKNQSFENYVKQHYGNWDKGFLANWGKDDFGRKVVSHICQYQNIDLEFAFICQKVGLPKIELPKYNTTYGLLDKPRPKCQEDYTPSLISFVKKVFAEDLELFGYSLENAK